MPSPSEVKDNVVKESTEKENLASDEAMKKQQQSMNFNASPRRKFLNRPASTHQNGNRNNRNNSGNNKRPNETNSNNNNNTKQQMGTYKHPQPQQQHHGEFNKKPQQQKLRSITKNGNYQYESPASAPPSLNNEPIEKVDNAQRKYSMDFLHQVGYNMSNVSMQQPQPQQQQSPKTPKNVDDPNLMALKIALGDNSGYYTHFYQGSMYGHGNPVILQQQQQQYQTYARYQQSQQQLQRVYGRNYQRWPTMYEPEPTSLPCHCPQQPIPAQRSYQQTYTNSATYQPRGKNGERREYREYRPTDSKKTRHLGYHNDRNFKTRDFRNVPPIVKSQSFTEEDTKRHSNHSYRSLSPTPPGSSKSSSPGAVEKSHEEDSASTSSGPSYNGDMKVSLSAPVLLTPDEPVKSVNLWINNNFGDALHNGLSYSAEHLNIPPITIIKRPSSTAKRSIVNLRNNPPYDPQYPFDYYLSRCDESEMRIAPMSFRSGTKYDRLSEQMWEKFQMLQQNRATYHSKMIIWRDLYNSVKNFPLFHQRGIPRWGLYLVGSTISGFGSDSSDIDMCLVLKDNHFERVDPRMEAMVTLNDLKNFLQNSLSPFQSFSLINAKVPILRFRDATNKIEIDLNYNNCIGVRNTQLLHSYSQLDWRLRPLALVVKLWARFHNINDARNSTISSYSLVLMVIHFLQFAVKPAVLPCLHDLCPDKFAVKHDITTIDMVEKCEVNWKSENRQTLGELFLRFLDYYSNFDYTTLAISIRTGGVLPIEECKIARSLKNDPNHWQTLCIEEPFDLTNTARSAYDGEVFRKIKEVFFGSFYRLKDSRSLESVFRDPLFTQQQQQQFMMGQMKYMVMAPPASVPMSMAVTNDVKS